MYIMLDHFVKYLYRNNCILKNIHFKYAIKKIEKLVTPPNVMVSISALNLLAVW
jgi:hypothetical protein